MSVVLTRPPKDGLVRALPALNRRATPTDPDGDGDVDAGQLGTLVGHFLRFDVWTEINSYFEGNFIESIAPGAIKKTLSEGRDSIRCLFQHGMDYQAGDKPLGPISVLEEDDEGGYAEVPLIDTSYNRDLAPGIDAGLYGQSFCFGVIREDFNEEPDPSDYNPKGLPERIIRELRIVEFGPVTFPAYDDADVSLEGSSKGMRSMTDSYLAEMLKRDPSTVEQILERAARPAEFSEMLRNRGVRNVPRLRAQEPPAEQPEAEDADAALNVAQAGEDGAAAREQHAQEQLADAAQDAAEAAETREEPTPTEADQAEDPDTAGEEPAAVEEQDSSTTAPPEGADPDGHPRAGRRDPDDQTPEATRAAVDKKEITMTLEERKARQDEIRSRLVTIYEEHGDADLPEAVQTEYDSLTSERAENDTKIQGIEARQAEVRQLATQPGRTEEGDGTRGAHFNVAPEKEANVYDLESVMKRARGAETVERRGGIMRDAALRAIDQEKRFYAGTVQTDQAKEYVGFLLEREAQVEGLMRSEIAERVLATGSETYQRGFAKTVSGSALTPEETRALASFTNNAGGYAVPYVLDPTIIPTSNYSVNPYRAIARKETIVGSNEWKGVTSGAVTVAYAAEGAEASDNSPTLAQPTANPERCQAFVPFSYEVEGDWPALLNEMAGLIAEGKDDVEATKFTSGAGHGSKEPEGLLTGATEVVATATAKTFVIADFFKLEEELAPRFRPRAQFVGGRFVYNKIRQFDTAGGAGLWVSLPQGIGQNVPTPGNIKPTLSGLPVWEASPYASGLTTTNKLLTIGDFRYFLIVDRVGMNIELIPTLFGGSGRPTGQRGLYAFWRNTSKVLEKKAFKTLEVS